MTSEAAATTVSGVVPQLSPPSVVLDNDYLFIGRVHGVTPHNRVSMRAQAANALAKIRDLLSQHGLGLEHVVQAHYLAPYGSERSEFGSSALLLQQAFGDPRPRLTRVAATLFPPGALIQLEIRARRA